MALLGTMIRCFRSGNGATAVEFSILALPFFAMLFGVVEIGRAMWTKGTMQFAVEEAARHAIVNKSDCPASGTCTGIVTFCNGRLVGLKSISCTAVVDSSDPDHKFVIIEVVHAFETLVPGLLPTSWGTFNIKAKARINLN